MASVLSSTNRHIACGPVGALRGPRDGPRRSIPLGALARGQLELRYRPVPGPSDSARLLYSLGHQLIFAAFTISALAGWLVLDGRHEAQRAAWALYAAGGCGAALLLSMLTTSVRKKRRDGPGAPR